MSSSMKPRSKLENNNKNIGQHDCYCSCDHLISITTMISTDNDHLKFRIKKVLTILIIMHMKFY